MFFPHLLICTPAGLLSFILSMQAGGRVTLTQVPPTSVCLQKLASPVLSVGFAQRLGFNGLCKPFMIHLIECASFELQMERTAVYGASWSTGWREAPRGFIGAEGCRHLIGAVSFHFSPGFLVLVVAAEQGLSACALCWLYNGFQSNAGWPCTTG